MQSRDPQPLLWIEKVQGTDTTTEQRESVASPGKKKTEDPAQASDSIADCRFDAKRANIPPAGLAAQGKLEEPRRIRYAYDPHRPPVLRFDGSGAADQWSELLATAGQRALNREEIALLTEALRQQQPWLEWAGKREKRGFEVEPVALHMSASRRGAAGRAARSVCRFRPDVNMGNLLKDTPNAHLFSVFGRTGCAVSCFQK